ncbi:hypothetical protein XENORESO_021929 [Xenotaenia resolanae]|uniref:LAGLIDADG homing endonuclease n=1 Tax=Xenotaenia resolanae TaxID=208358 RepID=A0ABV0WJV7_9TELE
MKLLTALNQLTDETPKRTRNIGTNLIGPRFQGNDENPYFRFENTSECRGLLWLLKYVPVHVLQTTQTNTMFCSRPKTNFFVRLIHENGLRRKARLLNCEPEQICLRILAAQPVWDGRREIKWKKKVGAHKEKGANKKVEK